jgi:hypothetical protein
LRVLLWIMKRTTRGFTDPQAITTKVGDAENLVGVRRASNAGADGIERLDFGNTWNRFRDGAELTPEER